MNRNEKRTFWTCLVGWALDAMDVQMYSFAIPAIVASGIATSYAYAGLVATATLLTSAIGGWVAGALSDRFGRVLTLQITIAWFAVFACLSGFALNYSTLFFFRALMGFGFGGAWAAAAVLVGEVIRSAADRGKAVGTMQSGWAVGWGGAVLATLLFSTLPAVLTGDSAVNQAMADDGTLAVTQGGVGLAGAQIAWRPLFWIGVLPAVLVVLYVRWFVDEPAVFKNTQRNLAIAGRTADFREIFSPPMLRTTILTCLLAAGAHGGYWAIMTWLPTLLLNERQLTVLQTCGYFFFVISGSWLGYVVSAWLSDLIGRRENFILFAVCSIVTVAIYTQIPANASIVMLVLGFPLGFFVSSVFSGIGPFFTELFPTRMRGSGQGFAYSFGRGIAALYPLLVGLGSAVLPLGQSIGVFASTAYGLIILAVMALPETRGRKLTAEAEGGFAA
jgi:MFS family permease